MIEKQVTYALSSDRNGMVGLDQLAHLLEIARNMSALLTIELAQGEIIVVGREDVPAVEASILVTLPAPRQRSTETWGGM